MKDSLLGVPVDLFQLQGVGGWGIERLIKDSISEEKEFIRQTWGHPIGTWGLCVHGRGETPWWIWRTLNVSTQVEQRALLVRWVERECLYSKEFRTRSEGNSDPLNSRVEQRHNQILLQKDHSGCNKRMDCQGQEWRRDTKKEVFAEVCTKTNKQNHNRLKKSRDQGIKEKEMAWRDL